MRRQPRVRGSPTDTINKMVFGLEEEKYTGFEL
jgi:hypothetical protein